MKNEKSRTPGTRKEETGGTEARTWKEPEWNDEKKESEKRREPGGSDNRGGLSRLRT